MRKRAPQRPKPGRDQSHMPSNSVFFDKVVPALLIGLAALTVITILVAVAVAIGVVPLR